MSETNCMEWKREALDQMRKRLKTSPYINDVEARNGVAIVPRLQC